MTRKRRNQPVDALIAHIDKQLQAFGQTRQELQLRQKVICLAEIVENVKDLGVSVVAEHGINAGGARERIRIYFVEHVGVVLDSIELAIVSGISAYARRIRELRVETGYQIASGVGSDPEAGIDLKPDQYILVTGTPDADAARRWHGANRIRKRTDLGSQKRILEFLLENVGKAVTTEEIAYVAKAKGYARRVRELRTEDGYHIATCFTGRPDLNLGQYILESDKRIAEPHDRHIKSTVQTSVYKRDKSTCRLCGWDINRWSSDDLRILELHHLEHHQHGGGNLAENLVVLCGKCHDEVHAGKHEELLNKIKHSL